MEPNDAYVKNLIKALSHWRALKRREAAYLLGEKRAPQAVPALVAVLESTEDPYVKMEAAGALGKIGGPQAIAALLRCLETQQALPVRLAAVEGLARQPVSSEIIASLRRAAESDPNEIMRRHARRTVQELEQYGAV